LQEVSGFWAVSRNSGLCFRAVRDVKPAMALMADRDAQFRRRFVTLTLRHREYRAARVAARFRYRLFVLGNRPL
jgi:hypothetical protein